MTERVFAVNEHPTSEELAALAEPGAPEWLGRDLAGHLAECRRCLAIYAEFVDANVRLVADPEVTAPAVELVELGMAVARSRTTPSRRTAQQPRRRLARVYQTATGLTVVLTVAVTIAIWPRAPRGVRPASEPATARIRAQRACTR